MVMAGGVLPDPSTRFGKRVERRLREERVLWMTTVGADGTPQPNPVWFIRPDQGHILVYSDHEAHRLAHLRQRPRVSLNFDGDGDGGDIVVISGRAEVVADQPPPHENPEYLAKYRQGMIGVSGSPEAFGAKYSVAVRVDIDRVRGF
jgi:PPOX class probable F420-dependent enzyme